MRQFPPIHRQLLAATLLVLLPLAAARAQEAPPTLSVQQASQGLWDARFSEDGRTLAAVKPGWRGLGVWDASTGRLLRSMDVFLFGASDTWALRGDGRYAAVSQSTQDKRIQVWDLTLARPPLVLPGPQGSDYCVRFTPDGRLVSWGKEHGLLTFWDPATGLPGKTVTPQGDLDAGPGFEVSPDGERLAIVTTGPSRDVMQRPLRLQLVSLSDGTGRFLDGPDRGCGVEMSFSSDGRRLLAQWEAFDPMRSTFLVYDCGSGQPTSRIEVQGGCERPVWTPDGKVIIVVNGEGLRGGEVILWNPAASQVVARWPGYLRSDFTTAACAPAQGLMVLYTFAHPVAEVRSMADGHLVAEIPGEVEVAAFSPRGDRFATLSRDGVGRVWQTGSWEWFESHGGFDDVGEGGDLAFLEDGSLLLVAGRTVFLPVGGAAVEIPGPDARKVLAVGAHGLVATDAGIADLQAAKKVSSSVVPAEWPVGLQFSPDGKTMALSGQEAVTTWDLALGHLRLRLPAAVQGLSASSFGAGNRLVVGTVAGGPKDESRCQIYDLDSGTSLGRLDGDLPWRGQGMAREGRVVLTSRSGQPGWVGVWDVTSTRLIRRFTGESYSLPVVAMSGSGVLAVGRTKGEVSILDPSGRLRTVKPHDKPITSMAFHPKGSILACGSQDGRISLLDPSSARVLRRLEAGYDPVGAEDLVFSPDGRFLASHPFLRGRNAPRDGSTLVWDVATGRRIARLPGAEDVSFHPGRPLVALGSIGSVLTADLGSGQVANLHEYDYGASDASAEVQYHPRGTVLAVCCNGQVEFRSASTGDSLASLALFEDGAWLAWTPDGFFDGSQSAWNRVFWRLGEDLFDVAEPEAFFQEFYQPGLLAEVVETGKSVRSLLQERGDPRGQLTIRDLDRRQPEVRLEATPNASERKVEVLVHVQEAPPMPGSAEGSGIRDLRLFRNGTLVATWEGDLTPGTVRAQVPIQAGENRLTAYAFNRHNVKSKDAEFTVAGRANLERAGRATVLALGVDLYQGRPDLSLKFAGRDAEDLAQALSGAIPGSTSILLKNEAATREGILGAINRLAQGSEPEDTVVISFSGHGFLHEDRFYLMPHDVAGLDDPDLLAPRSISDEDLEKALLPVQAERILLIIDACHSGGALGDDRKGPLNSRGLGQLAWEKGLEVITASQKTQVAREDLVGGGHGLLTHALLEGLGFARTRQVSVQKWLDDAAGRVPRLVSGQARAHRLSAQDEGPRIQSPRVFHRREGGSLWVLGLPASHGTDRK